MDFVRSRKFLLPLCLLLFCFFSPVKLCSLQEMPLYPITPFVVGNQNEANYQTIQSALLAAHKAGGGIVVIQPGIYNEDLILYDKTQVVGAIGLGDFGDFIIIGTHTPPETGSFSFRNVFLKSDNSIFSSKKAGTANLMLIDVAVAVHEGYTFNLPNWKGSLSAFDIGEIGSKDDGWVYNLGGANIFMTNLSMGFGSINPMVVSGSTFIFGAAVKCPVKFLKGSNGVIAGGTICEKQVVFEDDASFCVLNSTFMSNKTPPIVYNSSAQSSFSSVNVVTEDDFSLQGSGKGLLLLNGVSMSRGKNIAKSLNIDGGCFFTGELVAGVPGKGLSIAEGQNSKMGIAQLNHGSCKIVNSSVTNNSRIFLTPQDTKINKQGFLCIQNIDPGNGFNIVSSNKEDNSQVAWLIVEGN